jgi:uncharacterized RDD family membrane protein YckC
MRSPEGVELTLPIATPAPRMAAYFIDTCLLWFVFAGLIAMLAVSFPLFDWVSEMTAELTPGRPDNRDQVFAALAPLFVVLMLIWMFGEFLYFSLWELAAGGRTPGKFFLKLRVVGLDGQPLSLRASLLRNLLRTVDMLPSTYAIGLVAMVVSPRCQRLGDHAAGTLVIRTDRIERPEDVQLPPGIEPLALSREQLARIGVRELTLIRSTLRRVDRNQRSPAIDQAARALAARLALPPEELADPLRLLQRALLSAQRKAR